MENVPQNVTIIQPTGDPRTRLIISWDAIVGADSYNVYRNGVLHENIAANTTTDATVALNTNYVYDVTSIVGGVESAHSTPIVGIAVGAPMIFATTADLAAFWRSLNEIETTRATMLIELASYRLLLMASNSITDWPSQITADPMLAAGVKFVVLEAVKRAMLTPIDTPPVDQYAQTAGPYSENFKFTNPSGDLWFKKSELASIGLAGSQTLKGITTTREDIYS